MEFESKMTGQNGVIEYQVCLKDKVRLIFNYDNTKKYLITLSDKGVQIEPFFDKRGNEKDKQ